MAANIYTFKVTGISPLLMNNPACMGNTEESLTTRTKKIPKEQEAESRAYRTEEGYLYCPSVAFLNSLWNGAAYKKIGKDSARSRIQSAVFTTEDETILLDPETDKPITDYEIDSRYVVIKATKGRIMRYRPMVRNWYCLLSLEMDDDFIEVEQAVPLFNKAGRTIGVLNYRPAKRGPFGRYKAESYNGNQMKRNRK